MSSICCVCLKSYENPSEICIIVDEIWAHNECITIVPVDFFDELICSLDVPDRAPTLEALAKARRRFKREVLVLDGVPLTEGDFIPLIEAQPGTEFGIYVLGDSE